MDLPPRDEGYNPSTLPEMKGTNNPSEKVKYLEVTLVHLDLWGNNGHGGRRVLDELVAGINPVTIPSDSQVLIHLFDRRYEEKLGSPRGMRAGIDGSFLHRWLKNNMFLKPESFSRIKTISGIFL